MSFLLPPPPPSLGVAGAVSPSCLVRPFLHYVDERSCNLQTCTISIARLKPLPLDLHDTAFSPPDPIVPRLQYLYTSCSRCTCFAPRPCLLTETPHVLATVFVCSRLPVHLGCQHQRVWQWPQFLK